MNLFTFSFTRLRQLSIVLALSCLLLLPLYLGSLSDGAHARPQAPLAATPVVTFQDVPDEVLIGEQFKFKVTFDNSGPLQTDEGFGPFIDLVMPAGGADLLTGTKPCDGIEFVEAKMIEVNGGPLDLTDYTSLPADPCNPSPLASAVPHQYAANGVSFPSGVVVPAGGQLVTIELPFGSFEPSQPKITVEVTAEVHNFADVGSALEIYARGGFRFGDDALNNPSPPNQPILSEGDDSTMWTSADTTPTVFTVKKEYLGPHIDCDNRHIHCEDETVTGPNFPGQYQITVDIADGQEIENLVVTDMLPNNVVFLGVDSISVNGGLPVTSPVVTAPSTPANPPNNDLVIEFADPITGTSDPDDVVVTFGFYIPAEDADGNPILDPNSCEPAFSINVAKAEGEWTPLDWRDAPTVTVMSESEHTLTDKCLAIQKRVTIADDTGAPGPTPGDILEYTLNFQVSDYFAFEKIVVEDFLSDGQTLISGATLTVQDKNIPSVTLPFGSSELHVNDNQTLTCQNNIAPVLNLNGATHLTFDVSEAMISGGLSGILTGDPVGPPSGVPATGTITFQAKINDEFTYAPAGEPVVKHDPLFNCVTISAVEHAPVSGVEVRDESATGTAIVFDTLEKSIYARNGDPANLIFNSGGIPQFAAGDRITFRLKMTIPSSDADNVIITDWLPQPVLDVAPISSWPLILGPCLTVIPVSGDACLADFGGPLPNDTLSAPLSVFPSLTPDPDDNSLTFKYGDIDDSTNTPRTIDILFTLTVTDEPFADGLYLTNQAQECEDNTFGKTFCQVAVAQFEVTQPVLKITKGVVATNNPKGQFTPSTVGPVTFTAAPDNTCPRFTSTINSSNLASDPIDSNLSFVDANDWVTFAIVVENSGSGLHGAFDVQIKDTLPAKLFNVQNLCVTDGTGDPIGFTDLVGGLFGDGIELNDPGPTATPAGALDPDDPTSGRNIAVITFDAQLNPPTNLQKGQCVENKAELLRYAGMEEGENHIGSGYALQESDTATVCILPLARKSIVTTSEAHTSPNDSASGTPQLAIGEIVRYRLWVRLPEGTSPDFKLIDTLPAGLSLIDPSEVKISFTADNPMTLPPDLLAAQDNLDPPTFVFPSARLSTVGQTSTFDLGDLVNNDNDGDWELLIMEFNALVENTSANNNGNSKSNRFTVKVDGQSVATSNTVNAQIVEPALTVSKEVVSGTTVEVGGTVTYQIEVENTGSATAFDVQITDSLPGCLEDLQVQSIVNPSGGAVGILDNSTSSTLDVTVEELPVGESVIIKIAVQVSCLECDQLSNTVKVSYTSLPGPKGTVSNKTESDTPGASGDADGERNGSGGVNDYVAQSEAPLCGKICGVKFHDQDEDGVQDADEPTLSGWVIEIRDEDGNLVTTVTTDANGEYCFDPLLPGSYNISEIQQNGWSQTSPPAPGDYTINLAPGQELTGFDFGNTQASCTEPPGEMVAWWHFDEITGTIAADIAMFPNNGTHVGGPTPTVGDFVLNSLSFNGIDQYVEVLDHPEINFGMGDFSIDAWIRTTDALGVKAILDKREQTPNGLVGYYIYLLNGNLGVQLADGTFTDYTSSAFVADGEWHHIAVTIDRGLIGTWYVDGMPADTFSPTSHMGNLTNGTPLYIGRSSISSTEFFSGTIDEVEFFTRTLELPEVWNIYNANTAGKCKGAIHGQKFNDLNGNGVKDPGEPGLEGWTITLTDANGNTWTTTTDANGNYWFMPLTPGTYTVSEVQQSGWTQTFPAAPGTHTVTLEAGEVVEDIDFGNSTDQQEQCDLSIRKEHEGDTFFYGESGVYDLTVSNNGNETCEGPITITDMLPEGMSVPPGTFTIGGWSCTANALNPQTITCTHPGPLAPMSNLPLSLTVNVPNVSSAGGFGWNGDTVENCATVNGPNDSNDVNNESCDQVPIQQILPDLGDAPDSTNHSGHSMTTYAPANFPTVYDPSAYPSPVGPKHNSPRGDAWLGEWVSREANADQTPDEDGDTNIDPPSNAANRDGYDDGVHLNTVSLPNCGFTSFEYDVKVVGGAGTRTLNVWFDYNKDGDWEDTVWCTIKMGPLGLLVPVREWAVQNHPVNLMSNGLHTKSTPLFLAKRPQSASSTSGPILSLEKWRTWMRVTLTGENDPQPPQPSAPCPGSGIFFGPCPADGRGPIGGYEFGETEDYLVIRKWGIILADPLSSTSVTFAQPSRFTDLLTVPPGAVSTPMSMTVDAVQGAPLLGSQRALRQFEVNAYSGEESQLVPDFAFQKPVTVTLHYSDTEVAGGDGQALVRHASEEDLELRRYDAQEGDWVNAACAPVVRHSDENKLEVPICKTGEFVLAAPITTGVILAAPVITDGTAGEQVQVPITIEPYTPSLGVDSYEFTLRYDPSVVEITGVSQEDTLSSEWTVTADTTVAGQIKVVANGATSLPLLGGTEGGQEGGTLINLTGQLISAGASSTLTFSDEQFNEGDVQVYSQPGFLATKNQLYLPMVTR